MTTNDALQVIFECADSGVTNQWGQDMDYKWSEAMAHKRHTGELE